MYVYTYTHMYASICKYRHVCQENVMPTVKGKLRAALMPSVYGLYDFMSMTPLFGFCRRMPRVLLVPLLYQFELTCNLLSIEKFNSKGERHSFNQH